MVSISQKQILEYVENNQPISQPDIINNFVDNFKVKLNGRSAISKTLHRLRENKKIFISKQIDTEGMGSLKTNIWSIQK